MVRSKGQHESFFDYLKKKDAKRPPRSWKWSNLIAYPGHEYTGAGTDLSELRVPVDVNDAASQAHDIKYSNPHYPTDLADQEFIDEQSDTGTWSGNFAASIISAKKHFDNIFPGVSDTLIRGKTKYNPKAPSQMATKREAPEVAEGGPEAKVPKLDGNPDADQQRTDFDGGLNSGGSGGGGGGAASGQGGRWWNSESAKKQKFSRACSRTFQHYCMYDYEESDSWTSRLVIKYDEFETEPFNYSEVTMTLKTGWFMIPYQTGQMPMTDTFTKWMELNASAFRVKKCGFHISNIIPYSDELSNLSGSTVENTAFNTTPFLMTFIDNNAQRMFPNVILNGESVLKYVTNNFGRKNIPTTRTEGQLQELEVSYRAPYNWIKNALGYGWPGSATDVVGDGSLFADILNGEDWGTVKAGEDFDFVHDKPGPEVLATNANIGVPFGQGFTGNDPDYGLMTMGRKHMAEGNVLPTGQQIYSGQNGIQAQYVGIAPFAQNSPDQYTKVRDMNNSDTAANCYGKYGSGQAWELSNGAAPFALVKPVPLLKSDGSLMKIGFSFTCEYGMEVEIENQFKGLKFTTPYIGSSAASGGQFDCNHGVIGTSQFTSSFVFK